MSKKQMINEVILDPFTGEPFTVPHPKKLEVVPEAEGGNGKIKRPVQVDLDNVQAVRVFLNQLGRQQGVTIDMEDSAHAQKLFAAIREADRGGFPYIEVDCDDSEWLIAKFKEHGTKIFGLNAAAVLASFRAVYAGSEEESPQEVGASA